MRVLLVTPPMSQLNAPYPATTVLTGFLRSRGVDAVQDDLSLRTFLALASPEGLDRLRDAVRAVPSTPLLEFFLDAFDDYRRTVGPVIRFLQGADPTLAHRLAARTLVPEGPSFGRLDAFEGDDPLAWAFGALGVTERAKHLATLYVDDLAAVIGEVDPRFRLVKYAEQLAASQPSYDPLADALAAEGTLVDRTIDELAAELVLRQRPALLALTAPFAGNLYGALRVAQAARRALPGLKVALGGGYVNTELRELSEPRLFDVVDFVVRDDGEAPLQALVEHLAGDRADLRRTFVREGDRVVYAPGDGVDVPFAATGTPTTDGLPLDRYLSVLELLNPMHRLWSDGRWNKVLVAKGCYWKKCAFCDVSLPYISGFEAASAAVVVDRMDALVAETGQTGFHLVDEAAPPKALAALADELVRRGRSYTWWGNIRFEKTFTPELCQRLADGGCIAVTGGLEVASDRLLQRMAKGVSVAQVARVTRAFTEAGILVHAYLMYGFPTQTTQETVDSLELVRQLFAEDCVQSAFWHRFSATVHSPIGQDPASYGIEIAPARSSFAKNDVTFDDPTGTDHDALGPGLERAVYNFMHGVGLDEDVRRWFDGTVPKTSVRRDTIRSALRA